MNTASYARLLALVVAAAPGCVSEDAFITRAESIDEAAPIGIMDTDPTAPGISPELGICGEIVAGDVDDFVIGDYTITSPADVEMLEDYVAVTGRLDLAIDEVVDLSALDRLRCIGADLRIGGTALESLEGLDHLEYIGGHLLIEDAPVLRDLDGFRDLSIVMGELRVRRAHRLTDLSGLKYVGSVGHLIIDENEHLQSIDGLCTLLDIDGTVLIHANPRLESLDGIAALAHVGGPIRVVDNPRLPSCEVAAWALPLVPNENLDNAQLSGNDDNATCK